MDDEERFSRTLEWVSKAAIAAIWAFFAILVFSAFSAAFGQSIIGVWRAGVCG